MLINAVSLVSAAEISTKLLHHFPCFSLAIGSFNPYGYILEISQEFENVLYQIWGSPLVVPYFMEFCQVPAMVVFLNLNQQETDFFLLGLYLPAHCVDWVVPSEQSYINVVVLFI